MARQLLILGGGYGGTYAALGAARERGDADVAITLVSAEPDLVNRPRLYEPEPGPPIRYPLEYPLEPMLTRVGVGFRLGRVTAIDVDVRRVMLDVPQAAMRTGSALIPRRKFE
jgi:NADH:ubiquinone reductase (H+-translocating)